MREVVPFPNTHEPPVTKEGPTEDFEAITYWQADLLQRWTVLGSEIKRRFGPLPIDLALELSELIRESRV